MKLSDNEIRSQILAHLQLKGELATSAIINFCSAWTNHLKVRDILQSLSEENLVTVRRAKSNGKSSLFWTRVAFASDVGKQVMEQLESEISVAKPVVSQKDETLLPEPISVESVTHVQLAKDITPLPLNEEKPMQEKITRTPEEVEAIKHEYEIIIRKLKQRKTQAEKVIRCANSTLAEMEAFLKELDV